MGIVTDIISTPWEINRGNNAFSNSITYAHPPPLSKMTNIYISVVSRFHSPISFGMWPTMRFTLRFVFFSKKNKATHYKSRLPLLIRMAPTVKSGPPAPHFPLVTVPVPKFLNVSLQGNVGGRLRDTPW